MNRAVILVGDSDVEDTTEVESCNPGAPLSSSPQRNNGLDTSVIQPFTRAPAPPDDDVSFEKFLAGSLGTDLEPHIIAHDKNIVSCMDHHKLPWGVQYEIARGVTEGIWSWASVEAKIPQLCGSNSEKAHKVRNIMLDRVRPPSALGHSVWQELDREQDAIMENKGRGLGPVSPEGSEDTWYGGQIQQIARLVGDKGEYRIRLEPMETKRSYRLARFLGSRRILQLRIPKDLILHENKQLKEFMQHKFVLCGRVFVPFCAKDHSVYLVETAEDYGRCAADWAGDQFRMSFKDIINWHNPLHLNADQPINKYATRFALAFSTSIPVLEFKEENINFIPDNTDTWRKPGKPPAEYIKTDGCGFINEAALKIIAHFLNSHTYSVVIQGRVYGGKGLWILHPTDRSPEPKIWIRSSQRKIVYQRPVDRAHLIFDLLTVSRVSSPESSVRLSEQSIINLSNNGVPDTTLIDIMKKAFIEEVKPLMKWQGPQAMEILWNFIDRMSSVSRTRLTRVTTSMARALGLAGQAWREEEIEIERNGDTPPIESEGIIGIYTGRASSGVPPTLSEYVMELLQAGFHPKDSTLLKEKIRNLVKNRIQSIVEEFSIPLPESLNAFIVPDPLGVLKEGEVYYRSSVPIVNSVAQDVFNVLTAWEVMAVDRPELSRWVDVLIASTQGEKSFASMLSGGGEYDYLFRTFMTTNEFKQITTAVSIVLHTLQVFNRSLDSVFILFSNSLLEDFKNKPVKPIPPSFMDDNFQKHPERVKQFAGRVSSLASQDVHKAFADILMTDIDDKKFGLYSNWQDYAIYAYGYEDPRSERLAYM
ncbi:hypothetical protein C0993_005764 [Termitomyces sp. T159_Od127]|nr:hypothetical protein C0993_005764 [Termitomyces sp. T159_Od127]